MFKARYSNVFEGDSHWQSVSAPTGENFAWDELSTYIRNPSFFEKISEGVIENFEIENARVLALMGDSVTTDHISPAGNIAQNSPAGKYLINKNVEQTDFNSYGSRRGNHEVMMRGTFANIRIKNEMVPGIEGGYTKHIPTGTQLSIYDASIKYQESGTPASCHCGQRIWNWLISRLGGKGTNLLGVRPLFASPMKEFIDQT